MFIRKEFGDRVVQVPMTTGKALSSLMMSRERVNRGSRLQLGR